MLGLGMLVWSIAQVAGGFIQTLNHFLIARVVLGVAEAPLFPAGAKVVNEWFAVRERGAPTGTFISSSTIAPMIAPPLLTVLMLSFGWRTMFIIMGVLGILVALGWYMVYRNRDEIALTEAETAHLNEGSVQSAERARKGLSFAEWGALFKLRNTWGMIFGFMGVIYMVWLYLTWLPGYLENERHLSIAHTGWLVSIPYIFGTIGMVSSGYVADFLLRRGMAPIRSRKWPVCVGLIGAAAFTVPAAYTPSTALAIVYRVAGDVLRESVQRQRVGARDGCRAPPPRGVARQHAELRRLSGRLVCAGDHGHRGRSDAFVRQRAADQRGGRVRRRLCLSVRGEGSGERAAAQCRHDSTHLTST